MCSEVLSQSLSYSTIHHNQNLTLPPEKMRTTFHLPPTKVYELESILPQWYTLSMGSPTISSDTEPASDRDSVHSPPQPTPEKSKPHQPRKPKAKQIVVKKKVYKIC